MLASIRTVLLLVLFVHAAHAQTFVRVTDPQNEAAVTPGQTGYRGCAWVDYDNDGDDDLWVNRNLLYRNDGNGVFDNALIGIAPQNGLGSGGSWADYDNDGDLDLYIASSPRSALFRNDGNAVFTEVDSGDIGATGHDYRGWSGAWGDYDSDGNVDLIITHPAGFLGNPSIPNLMFHNDGPPDYTFTRVTTGDVVTGLDAYTVGSFADYDLDGDLDFFIGTGEVSAASPDYFYRNTLRESGDAALVRWTGVELTDQTRDGQNINWIDIENDGDLDCYITNYTAGFNNGRANDLYRNDDGTYVRVTEGTIVTDRQVSLGNCWADFDNDGYLDCVVANETGTNKYYRNNGDGTFESVATVFTVAGSFRCPAAGDYDDDGDLDLFITADGAAQGFYRNETVNGNHWLKLRLTGTAANRAAIGAIVRVKAAINGQAMWQTREVNTQNSFNGHNSLIQHFGLSAAEFADSIEIRWPSGLTEYFTNAVSNITMDVVEGEATTIPDHVVLPGEYALKAYPNPFNGSTELSYSLHGGVSATLRVVNLLGREVWRRELRELSGRVDFAPTNLASGSYFVELVGANQTPLLAPVRLVYLK